MSAWVGVFEFDLFCCEYDQFYPHVAYEWQRMFNQSWENCWKKNEDLLLSSMDPLLSSNHEEITFIYSRFYSSLHTSGLPLLIL